MFVFNLVGWLDASTVLTLGYVYSFFAARNFDVDFGIRISLVRFLVALIAETSQSSVAGTIGESSMPNEKHALIVNGTNKDGILHSPFSRKLDLWKMIPLAIAVFLVNNYVLLAVWAAVTVFFVDSNLLSVVARTAVTIIFLSDRG